MSILHRAFTFLLLLFALTSFASQIMAVGDPCTLPGVQVITDPTGENLTLKISRAAARNLPSRVHRSLNMTGRRCLLRRHFLAQWDRHSPTRSRLRRLCRLLRTLLPRRRCSRHRRYPAIRLRPTRSVSPMQSQSKSQRRSLESNSAQHSSTPTKNSTSFAIPLIGQKKRKKKAKASKENAKSFGNWPRAITRSSL